MEEYEGSKKRARGEGGKARKACPQGNRCPYQDEYQHNLEFSHDHNPKDPPNQRFGAKENIKIQGDNSMAFAGNGLRLGTGTGGNRLLETFEQQLQEKQHNQPLPPKKDDIPSTGVHSAPGTMRCNLCGLSLPREDAKDHFLLHQLTAKESTRNPASSSSSSNPYRNLTSSDPIMIDITPDKTRQLRHDRQEQDVEYDESVLEEIRKKSEEEELEKMRLLKETQAKEREAYNIAKKESKRLLEIGKLDWDKDCCIRC